MITIAIILITVLYIAPLLGCYVWIQKAYSKGGVYQFTTPDGEDFWTTICPVLNIVWVFGLWSDSPLKNEKTKKKEWIAKFFGIKH